MRRNQTVSQHQIDRRRFLLASGSLLGVRLGSAPDLLGGAGGGPPEASTGIIAILEKPPLDARPRTRWWWFGGAVTKEELSRELELMSEAGIGGVEIQPVYPLAIDDPGQGIRNIPYFSAEWHEILRHSVLECRRLGLSVDLTLGSGWPFGGPFIPLDLAARTLRTQSREVRGPTRLSWDLAPEMGEGTRLEGIVATPLDEAGMPKPENSITLRVPRGQNRVTDWEVPRGAWRVTAVVDAPTYMQVKRPTLGMEGFVLDHFNEEAVRLFLRAVGDRTLEELKDLKRPFDAVFCDSLEVYGADWTPNLLEEFRQRRGYDLLPYLPMLLEELGPATPRVRYDYHRTLSELTLERFFQPMVEWARSNGMKARVQAHGAMGDIVRAYGLVDVPEGEMIFGGDRYRANIKHRRLASSAGHIYGRTLISAETYTWLRTPMFLVTLEMMKVATDAMFLDGINQIVNHGFPYSPPAAGSPGWTFYASTVVNHNNIWWRHYPDLAGYVRSVSAVLRLGRPVNRIAIYIPLAEIFSEQGRGGFHLDEEIDNQLGQELADSLRFSGYDFDFVNDHSLVEMGSLEGKTLKVGAATYDAVLVPSTRWIPAETIGRLVEFAEAGGTLLFLGALPHACPGLLAFPSGDGLVKAQIERVFGAEPSPGVAVQTGKGRALWAEDVAALIQQASAFLQADFSIAEVDDGGAGALVLARETIGFVRRRVESVDLFFLANLSPQERSVIAHFDVGHRSPVRVDPLRGGVRSVVAFSFASEPGSARPITRVRLHLDPFESCFLLFESSEKPLITDTNCPSMLRSASREGQRVVSALLPSSGDYWVETPDKGRRAFSQGTDVPLVTLSGPWSLRLENGLSVTLDRLVPWSEIAGAETFSGWGSYELDFAVGKVEAADEWVLDLGELHDTAEASLNGFPLGRAWKRPRRLSCGKALLEGRNRLKIEVGNVWIHHVNALPTPDFRALEESYGIRWGRYGEVPPEAIPPSGLLGPVRLIPLQHREAVF